MSTKVGVKYKWNTDKENLEIGFWQNVYLFVVSLQKREKHLITGAHAYYNKTRKSLQGATSDFFLDDVDFFCFRLV